MRSLRVINTIAIIISIPLYIVGFNIALDVRKTLANLSRAELSTFLLNLLMKGAACLSTMLFFTFEVLVCWIDNEDDKLCLNTSTAVLYLSTFLVIGTAKSLFTLAMPKAVRNVTVMTKEHLASLDVKKKELVQIVLLAAGGVSALSLLSSLGVASAPQETNKIIGLVGFASLAGVLFIEATTLLKNNDIHLQHLSSGVQPNLARIQSDRRLSSGTLSEGVSLGGLV